MCGRPACTQICITFLHALALLSCIAAASNLVEIEVHKSSQVVVVVGVVVVVAFVNAVASLVVVALAGGVVVVAAVAFAEQTKE